jgi:hypothetical protein
MESRDMQVNRICHFRTRAEKKVERVLMSFVRSRSTEGMSLEGQGSMIKEEEILLYESGERWSARYSQFTHDLYLPRPERFQNPAK